MPLALRSCGYLFLAETSAALAQLTANVAVQNAEGIASRIVNPYEAAELVPGLAPEAHHGGAWFADDGYFDRPQSVIEAFEGFTDADPTYCAQLAVYVGGEHLLDLAQGMETDALLPVFSSSKGASAVVISLLLERDPAFPTVFANFHAIGEFVFVGIRGRPFQSEFLWLFEVPGLDYIGLGKRGGDDELPS